MNCSLRHSLTFRNLPVGRPFVRVGTSSPNPTERSTRQAKQGPSPGMTKAPHPGCPGWGASLPGASRSGPRRLEVLRYLASVKLYGLMVACVLALALMGGWMAVVQMTPSPKPGADQPSLHLNRDGHGASVILPQLTTRDALRPRD